MRDIANGEYILIRKTDTGYQLKVGCTDGSLRLLMEDWPTLPEALKALNNWLEGTIIV